MWHLRICREGVTVAGHFHIAFAGALTLFFDSLASTAPAGLFGYREKPLKNEAREETP
jgi:hypothetical protein